MLTDPGRRLTPSEAAWKFVLPDAAIETTVFGHGIPMDAIGKSTAIAMSARRTVG
ncbi:hypothetical protein [Nisaea sp.]|uniref:hypothetical protein n=1 Tax=Nisaea sp. TaxID=2024842 RepID=UPI003B526669